MFGNSEPRSAGPQATVRLMCLMPHMWHQAKILLCGPWKSWEVKRSWGMSPIPFRRPRGNQLCCLQPAEGIWDNHQVCGSDWLLKRANTQVGSGKHDVNMSIFVGVLCWYRYMLKRLVIYDWSINWSRHDLIVKTYDFGGLIWVGGHGVTVIFTIYHRCQLQSRLWQISPLLYFTCSHYSQIHLDVCNSFTNSDVQQQVVITLIHHSCPTDGCVTSNYTSLLSYC